MHLGLIFTSLKASVLKIVLINPRPGTGLFSATFSCFLPGGPVWEARNDIGLFCGENNYQNKLKASLCLKDLKR